MEIFHHISFILLHGDNVTLNRIWTNIRIMFSDYIHKIEVVWQKSKIAASIQ